MCCVFRRSRAGILVDGGRYNDAIVTVLRPYSANNLCQVEAMTMRKLLRFLGLIGLVVLPSVPAAPAAISLEQLGARMNGTWKWNFESYRTRYSQASKLSGNIVRECHRGATTLLCVETLGGRLFEVMTFVPVAEATTYSAQVLDVATKQPIQTLTMGENSYVASESSKDSKGNFPSHGRAKPEARSPR